MARIPITISVPEWMHRYIEERVNEVGFSTVSEYFRELVRSERQRQINQTSALNRYAQPPVPVPAPPYRPPLASAARRK